MAPTKESSASNDLLNLLWIVAPLVLAFYIRFVWVVALVFLAMSYMIRTGREPKWYIWTLHACVLLLALRIGGFLYVMELSDDMPPPFQTKAEFVARHPVAGRLAGADWASFEKAALEQVLKLVDAKADVQPDAIDPFTGKPLLHLDDKEGYRTYYSVGPDGEDQRLETKWDRRKGVFTPGDVSLRSVFVGDSATTPTN